MSSLPPSYAYAEMSVIRYQTTQCNNPEEQGPQPTTQRKPGFSSMSMVLTVVLHNILLF
jgi:hypothetical protein